MFELEYGYSATSEATNIEWVLTDPEREARDFIYNDHIECFRAVFDNYEHGDHKTPILERGRTKQKLGPKILVRTSWIVVVNERTDDFLTPEFIP
jgi:hypothetical protein